MPQHPHPHPQENRRFPFGFRQQPNAPNTTNMSFPDRTMRSHSYSEKSRSSGAKMMLQDFSLGAIIRLIIRILQFVMGLTVIGLYAHDLRKASEAHVPANRNWVYAVVVGTLSCVTSLIFLIPILKAWMFFAWDAFLWLLWIILFGIFGKLFIGEKADGDKGIQRMKNAVWIDLINVVLWLSTAIYGAWVFMKYWKERKAGPHVPV